MSLHYLFLFKMFLWIYYYIPVWLCLKHLSGNWNHFYLHDYLGPSKYSLDLSPKSVTLSLQKGLCYVFHISGIDILFMFILQRYVMEFFSYPWDMRIITLMVSRCKIFLTSPKVEQYFYRRGIFEFSSVSEVMVMVSEFLFEYPLLFFY